jgi:AcrR family transcriptional regulator
VNATTPKIRVHRKRPDSYQHGDLREALVQAGLKLLSEGGVETLTLRAAAQLAGVSHAAPYRHFRDKEALVAAIAERGFRLLATFMRAEVEHRRPTGTRARLNALGNGYLRFATTHPAYLRVIFGGALCTDEPFPELRAAGEEAYRVLRDEVAAGVARGDLRAGDPDRLSLACWSMIHGLATLIINRAIPPHLGAGEQLAGAMMDLLADGIER